MRRLATAGQRNRTASRQQRSAAACDLSQPGGSTPALDPHEPRDPDQADDARDVEVQPQPEDVVRRIDAQDLLADPRERVAGDVQREQPGRPDLAVLAQPHQRAGERRFQIIS